jgi:uncharacterized phage protein gp47/JayE
LAQFENETFDVIIERMLARLPDDIDKRQGSVVYDLLAPAAVELELAYAEMDNVLDFGFIDTTYGEYLDRRVAEQGLTRKEALKATGYVTFNGLVDAEVPEGTQLANSDEIPVYFVTTESVVLTNGTGKVAVEAVEGGSEGNIAANQISVVEGDLQGIVSVTNEEPFTGGLAEETDEELIERFFDRVRRPITSGNKYQYEEWAESINGISSATCYPTWNGPGTVKVVVVNTENRSPSAAVIQQVIDYIEEQRPVGAQVTVMGVEEVSIDVSAVLTLADGTDIETVREDINTRLVEYFKNSAFTERIVRYTQIGNAILDAIGVIDYSDLRINGLVSNIQMNGDQVPVVGAISVTKNQ